jgi:hypothetical protein
MIPKTLAQFARFVVGSLPWCSKLAELRTLTFFYIV